MLLGIDLITLTDITNFASILGSLSLVVSVWFLWRALQESNRLARASNTQTLVGLSSSLYLGLVQDRETANLYLNGSQRLETMDAVDRHRYKSLITWWLIFHENVYYQWRNRLLDDNAYQPWAAELRLFVSQQRLGPHWAEMKHLFQEGFAGYMDTLLAAEAKEPAPSQSLAV